MKQVLRYTIYLIAVFSYIFKRHSQPITYVCVEHVRSVYMKINDLGARATDNHQIYMRYTLKVEYYDSIRNKNTQSNAEVSLSKNKVQFKSNEAFLYQDEIYSFNILPATKIIYWSDAPPVSIRKNYASNGLLRLQDTLFDVSIAKECRWINEVDQKIILEFNQQNAHLFPFYQLEFLIDNKKDMLKKVIVRYPSGSMVKQVEYNFIKIDLDYYDPLLKKAAFNKIFLSDNHLLPEYEGYKVIDSRRNTLINKK
jgi:hypothetical protein